MAFCKGSTPIPQVPPSILPPTTYVDTSLAQLNVAPQLPIQQPLPQVQPIRIEPQPLPQPVRPVYPVNRIESPLVNRAFEPIYNIYQQKQMVPVQQVKMVPVQQVEMVPFEEFVPAQQIIPVQQIQQVHQIIPVQEVSQEVIQPVVENLPNITAVQDDHEITGITGGQVFQQGPAVENSSRIGFSIQDLI